MLDDASYLPRGCTLVDRGDCVTVRCKCDWIATRTTTDQAIDAAVEHARTDAWCYVHRNLTAVGADPVMGRRRPDPGDPMTDFRRYRIAHLIIDGPPLQSGSTFTVTLHGEVGPDLDEDAVTLRVNDWTGPIRDASPVDERRVEIPMRRPRDERVSLVARVVRSEGSPHVRVAIFAGPDRDHRASCGFLTLREGEADELLGVLAAGGVELAEGLSGVHTDAEGEL